MEQNINDNNNKNTGQIALGFFVFFPPSEIGFLSLFVFFFGWQQATNLSLFLFCFFTAGEWGGLLIPPITKQALKLPKSCCPPPSPPPPPPSSQVFQIAVFCHNVSGKRSITLDFHLNKTTTKTKKNFDLSFLQICSHRQQSTDQTPVSDQKAEKTTFVKHAKRFRDFDAQYTNTSMTKQQKQDLKKGF